MVCLRAQKTSTSTTCSAIHRPINGKSERRRLKLETNSHKSRARKMRTFSIIRIRYFATVVECEKGAVKLQKPCAIGLSVIRSSQGVCLKTIKSPPRRRPPPPIVVRFRALSCPHRSGFMAVSFRFTLISLSLSSLSRPSSLDSFAGKRKLEVLRFPLFTGSKSGFRNIKRLKI